MNNRIRTLGLGFALATPVLSFAGCAHETTPPPRLVEGDYRLGVDDQVEVSVWKDPALSATVPVRPDGKISLPMVGELPALGRTASEIQKDVVARLAAMVPDPTVAVMVKEIRAARFFVVGEVTHPGAYPLTGEMSVLQALAVAGGPTEFASRGKVVVIRKQKNKQPERFKVDFDDVVAGEAPALPLLAGDTIYVP